MTDFAEARRRMVETQLIARGVADPAVLKAMGEVPREAFAPAHLRAHAYADSALPIEEGQSISQPYIVARMIEAAAIGPGDRVLEIGAGSGYAAAVLSRIAAEVYAIERRPALARLAEARLQALGCPVRLRVGDGAKGWPEAAPFDAILAAAAAPRVPQPLLDQLRTGGRLVAPVGATDGAQRLLKLTRQKDGIERADDLGDVAFVPLIEGDV